nr:copia protein [Tanacetum cinerariifolium]
MHDEFEMSMMGELNLFLGLKIKQVEDGIFFNHSKYIKEMLKKFRLEDSKPTKTPMYTERKLTKDEEGESVDMTKYKGTTHLGLWYPKGPSIETVVYADSDHAGDYVDQKCTSGMCTFMVCCLTSWFSKKQTALAISTSEAEYISPVLLRTVSSPNHPTSNIEDAFSSNFLDFIPASPDYVPTSPRKTYSSSSNSFGVVPIVSPSLSLFHDDAYMKVMHAYYAEKSPIPPLIITPPSLMPNPQEFFLP